MNSTYQQSLAQSMISVKSQEIIDTASRISKNFNFYGVSENENDEIITKCWGAFGMIYLIIFLGLYISRQMRMGRGINIPHFGLFSFSAPGVQLEGVTNPEIRDKQNRKPVFLISKDFANGANLKAGIFIDNHLRPFLNQTSGSIQQTKINWSEIASYAQSSKDATKFAVERMIRVLADKCRQNQTVVMQIPGIGNFHVKNNVVAIQFNEQFVTTTQGIPKRPLTEKKVLGNMSLTQENLNFGRTLKQNLPTQLDDSGNQFLQKNYDINFHSHTQTSQSRYEKTIKPNSLLQRSLQISQLIRPDRTGDFNDKKNLSDLEQGLKMLNYWIRLKRYISVDAFLEMCHIALGRTRDRKVKMNLEQFSKASQNMELNLNENQILALFTHLDVNQDGWVDYFDWSQIIKDEHNYLNYIKDAIFKNNLHSDDILKTMGFKRDSLPVGLTQLSNGLLNLDQLLDKKQAEKVGLQILNGKKTITMQELINVFDSYEEAAKVYDSSWFKDMLFKIKERLVNSQNYFVLKRIFEEADTENQGSLDMNTFKKCLMRYLGISVPDITRIIRYIPKIKDNQVDFIEFLRMIDTIDVVAVSDEKVRTLYEFAEKLGNYLKKEKITIKQFLKNIWKFSKENNLDDISASGDVTVDQFTEYLIRYIFKQTSRIDLEVYTKEVDIDSDNYILDNDLKTFLQSYNFFEEIYFMDKEPTRHLTKSRTLAKNIATLNTKGLFPIKPLQEKKIETILLSLKKTLEYKNISNQQFFQMIDTDKDGFITIEEFSDSLERIFPLPPYIKNGLFAYIDKPHTGLLDFTLFEKFLVQSTTQPQKKIARDSYDWQYNMIIRIREWFGREKLTVEDAFKALDKHYRGEIKEGDLNEFLIEQIKIKAEDLTPAKVNRLFKLMDQFKKGSIGCEDFRRFLCEDFVQGRNQCVMGHKIIDNFSSFDWKLNARQQVGLVLTRRFKDLQHSYNMISGYHKKLVYNQFKIWINDTNCLRGFDITETQLKEFFADLDTHKKGYLTEQDWIIAFNGFDWKKQMVEEMKEMIFGNFGNMKKAFEFFLPVKKQTSFDFQSFKTAISYLLPERFIDSDISDLWQILSQGEPVVNFDQFEKCFSRKNGIYVKSYLDFTKKKFQESDLEIAGKTLEDIEDQIPVNSEAPFLKEGLIGRLRRFLRASNKKIDVELQKADSNDVGYLTNLQFKNIIKTMNFGLKSEEIDELLNLCSSEGKFYWKNFLKMVNFRDVDHRIIDRAKLKLEYITQLIYTYMLSPKDAFRIFDVDSKGYLTFDQFQKFIYQISFISGEQTPNYSIIKDMFDFIDKKKDDLIDLMEWMDVFSQYQYHANISVPKNIDLKTNRLNTMQNGRQTPKKLQEQRPTTVNYQVRKLNFNENKHQPTILRTFLNEEDRKKLEQKLGEWEQSKEFDKVLTAIGRNRKFLLNLFQQISSTTVLSYKVVQAVIEQMLRDSRVEVKQEAWPMLIKFAEKEGVIDYQFLLEVYKERIQRIDSHPIQNNHVN